MAGVLACDPGAKPGFCILDCGYGVPAVHYDPEIFENGTYDEAVFEDQFITTHIWRKGKKVRVKKSNTVALIRTAENLFQRFTAERKYRILPDAWRRILWPGASRLTKTVVLARLRAEYNTLVEHLPKTHQPDCLEAVGIAVAWSKLTQEQKEAYRVK